MVKKKLKKRFLKMKKFGALLILALFFCSTVNAKSMGLEKSNEIIASGKILKVGEQILDDGIGILDFWYVAFNNSLFYCLTTRGITVYIECYDKNSSD